MPLRRPAVAVSALWLIVAVTPVQAASFRALAGAVAERLGTLSALKLPTIG